jgi:hypothetical protein
MKKLFILVALLLPAIVTSLSVYGQAVKENRNVSGFNEVNFGGSGDLFISLGSGYQVTLEGSKSDIDNITTEVEGRKLNIKRKSRSLGSGNKIIVRITMPAIEGLGFSGSGNAEIQDIIKGESFDLGVSGSGKVLIAALDVEKLECGISGSGTVTVKGEGKVENAEVAISGSGSYSGEQLQVKSMEVAISGSGNCYCLVDGSLEASISGSGSVVYSGSPKIDAKVSGSGRVRSK